MISDINAALVVSGDTKSAVAATDEALLTHTLLFASALQSAKVIDLPINVTQHLYRTMERGVQAMLDSREAVRDSIGLMHKIAQTKGMEVVLEGCPYGFPSAETAQPATRASHEPIPAS